MASGKAPPKIPSELPELVDAVVLCGRVQKNGDLRLTMYERERLVRYCGRMPEGKKGAARWKIYLRALRKEVAAEPDPEDETC